MAIVPDALAHELRPCPTCGARRGELCLQPNRDRLPSTRTHPARTHSARPTHPPGN